MTPRTLNIHHIGKATTRPLSLHKKKKKKRFKWIKDLNVRHSEPGGRSHRKHFKIQTDRDFWTGHRQLRKEEQEWRKGLQEIKQRLSSKRKREETATEQRSCAQYSSDRRWIPRTHKTTKERIAQLLRNRPDRHFSNQEIDTQGQKSMWQNAQRRWPSEKCKSQPFRDCHPLCRCDDFCHCGSRR